MRDAYETDNGPGGMSWEVYREDGEWEVSLPKDADLTPYAPIRVWTFASFEKAQLAGRPMADGPDQVLLAEET